MGYAFCTSACFGCGRIFNYNPVSVPSIQHPSTGSKEPICLACVERVNPTRVANGLAPIVPAANAYEACDEAELA
jgi:hypothetical protein